MYRKQSSARHHPSAPPTLGPLAHLTFATPPSPHMREQTLTSASHAITLSVTAG
jgi:hypothetical protein